MNRTHAVLGLMALAVTLAFAAWSFAQEPAPPQPPAPPEPPEFFEREIEIDEEMAMDMDMPGPGMFMMQHGGRMAGGGTHGAIMMTGMVEELGLTEEQQTKLRALHFEGAKSGLQTRTNLRLRQIELQELLEQDEPAQAELDKRIKALTDAQAAATRQRIEHRMAFRRVLTPEQRAKLRSSMRERVHRRIMHFREGGDRMRMRGPGGEGFQWRQRRTERPPEPPL